MCRCAVAAAAVIVAAVAGPGVGLLIVIARLMRKTVRPPGAAEPGRNPGWWYAYVAVPSNRRLEAGPLSLRPGIQAKMKTGV